MTPRFLVAVIPEVITDLDMHGFVVTSVTCDGAGENRKALGTLATIPARDFLECAVGKRLDLIDSGGDHEEVKVVDLLGEYHVHVQSTAPLPVPGPASPTRIVDLKEEGHVWRDLPRSLKHLEDMPVPYEVRGHQVLDFFHHKPLPEIIDLSKQIAFVHPSGRSFVFINQDMPHIIKRCVNPLESSNPGPSKRSIRKHHHSHLEHLCLAMIKAAWEHVGGGDPRLVRDEHTKKLTKQHFDKDCFSRMRVPLAVQVVSEPAARICERVAGGEPGAFGRRGMPATAQQGYTSLIELCRKLNRIVDIMNARSEKGAGILNSPRHPLIYEALDLLKWFSDWRGTGPCRP